MNDTRNRRYRMVPAVGQIQQLLTLYARPVSWRGPHSMPRSSGFQPRFHATYTWDPWATARRSASGQ